MLRKFLFAVCLGVGVGSFVQADSAQAQNAYGQAWGGTYTTQGLNKRANRKSEFLLHDAEFLTVLAALLDPAYDHPAAELTEALRRVEPLWEGD